MREIIEINKLKQIFNEDLLSKDIEQYFTKCNTQVYHEVQKILISSNPSKLFLILDGGVEIRNKKNELIANFTSGFIGLSNLFPNILWQNYQVLSSENLKLLCLDASFLKNLMKKNKSFKEYLYLQATTLDLLILNHESNKNSKIIPTDLVPLISSLDYLSLKAGEYDSNLIKNNKDFLILHLGELSHTSGLELFPGVVYDCDSLPSSGKWLTMEDSRLFFSTQSEIAVEEIKQNASLPASVGEREFNQDTNYFDKLIKSCIDAIKQLSKLFNSVVNIRPNSYFISDEQQDSASLCLQMLANFYNINLKYDSHFEDKNISPSLSKLVYLAESCGFRVTFEKTDLTKITKLTAPAIAHCEANNYLVIYKQYKNQIIIGDPRTKQKVISKQKFCNYWSGWIICLHPQKYSLNRFEINLRRITLIGFAYFRHFFQVKVLRNVINRFISDILKHF